MHFKKLPITHCIVTSKWLRNCTRPGPLFKLAIERITEKYTMNLRQGLFYLLLLSKSVFVLSTRSNNQNILGFFKWTGNRVMHSACKLCKIADHHKTHTCCFSSASYDGSLGKGWKREAEGHQGREGRPSFYSVFPQLTGLRRRAAYVHLKAQMAHLPIISKARRRKLKVILFSTRFYDLRGHCFSPQPENTIK